MDVVGNQSLVYEQGALGSHATRSLRAVGCNRMIMRSPVGQSWTGNLTMGNGISQVPSSQAENCPTCQQERRVTKHRANYTCVRVLWKSASWYKTFCTSPSRDATPASSLPRQLHFPCTEGGIRFSAWTIWTHLDHHGLYQNFSLGVRIWTKGESGIWVFDVRTAFQRAAGHTHGCPTLSSKNSMLQKDDGQEGRTWKSQRRGTEDITELERGKSKVESLVWLEGERQLVTVVTLC